MNNMNHVYTEPTLALPDSGAYLEVDVALDEEVRKILLGLQIQSISPEVDESIQEVSNPELKGIDLARQLIDQECGEGMFEKLELANPETDPETAALVAYAETLIKEVDQRLEDGVLVSSVMSGLNKLGHQLKNTDTIKGSNIYAFGEALVDKTYKHMEKMGVYDNEEA